MDEKTSLLVIVPAGIAAVIEVYMTVCACARAHVCVRVSL